MRISNLSARVLGSATVALLLVFPAISRRAYAFGGFWSSSTTPVRPSAEEILFVNNPDATITAIIRIEYTGPPQKFAWVVPLPGKPKVGVSSNTVFQRLDAATAPRYWVEVAGDGVCAPQDAAPDAGSANTSAPGQDAMASTSVGVVDRGSVGPYEYVNLSVDPTRGDSTRVVTDWFQANGFAAASIGIEVLRPYLREGLHLLAFKLVSSTDVGAVRPVALTYEAERPVIPIRPMARAAREEMGILVWVVGPSQAVPVNSRSLLINDARIDWLSARTYTAGTLPAGGVGPFDPHYVSKPSNYDAVVSDAAHQAGGQGFVTELGAPASQYRDKVWSSLDEQQFARMADQAYADGVDAIVMASRRYRDWDGYEEAIRGATALPDGVTVDEFGSNPSRYRGMARVDAAKFFRLLDREAIRPVVDAAALLSNAPYLTRFYTRLSGDEMSFDPAFDYNADLALVSNIHLAKQFVRCGPRRHPGDASWRMELPQGGMVAGKGRTPWPATAGAMPANLKLVQLTTTGSGVVVKDNSDEIGMALPKMAGPTDRRNALTSPPRNGVLIGGSQTLPPAGSPGVSYERRHRSGAGRCSVSQGGACADGGPIRWLLPLCGILARRRRLAGRRRVERGELLS